MYHNEGWGFKDGDMISVEFDSSVGTVTFSMPNSKYVPITKRLSMRQLEQGHFHYCVDLGMNSSCDLQLIKN